MSSRHLSKLVFALLAWAVSRPRGAAAQELAGCRNSSLDWMISTQDLTPCQMTVALLNVCPDSVEIGDLMLGPPSRADANDCICNTVTFSLLSACLLCDGSTSTPTFDKWTTNCSTVSVVEFPFTIPANMTIPAYAFMDPYENVFDVEQAAVLMLGTAGSGDGVAVATGVTTGAGGLETGIGLPVSGSTGFEVIPSDTGKIVGGTIGGFVAGMIVGAGLLYFFLRRKLRRTPSSAMARAYPFGVGTGRDNAGNNIGLQQLPAPDAKVPWPNEPTPSYDDATARTLIGDHKRNLSTDKSKLFTYPV